MSASFELAPRALIQGFTVYAWKFQIQLKGKFWREIISEVTSY